MYRYYSVVVWTMGVPDYAGPVLDYIEDKVKLQYGIKKVFTQRLYKRSCEENGCKDLNKLNVDLTKVVAVDDLENSFLQSENQLVIPRYEGNKEDAELTKLGSFLKQQSKLDDVRFGLDNY